MTAIAAVLHPSLNTRNQEVNQHKVDKAVRKVSDLVNTKTFADFKFKAYDGGTKQKPVGLSDGSNIQAHHNNAGGYGHKVRCQSVNGKVKEQKKVPLVRANSKVFFKPAAGRKPGGVAEKKQFSVPVPHHVVPNDHELSPMDVDSPMVRIRHMMTRKPHGVVDIDAVKDPLACSEYAQEIVDYLQMVERRYTIPKNYLTHKGGDLTPYMRTMLVDWLIQVQVHQSLSQHALHLCVNLLDKVLSKHLIRQDTLQLVGITCLLLSAKYHDRFPPEISDLCYLTDETYNPNQVLKMERYILRKLDFDLNLPGPVTFLERFLLVHQCEKNTLIQSMSMYLVDLTLTEMHFVHFYPSLIAATAIYVARELLGCDFSWDNAFAHYTKYSEHELLECSQAMKRCLAKLSKSKYTGAKVKYAHHDYNSISNHKVLNPTELWPDQHVNNVDIIQT